ncbi:MAG: DUF1778 domain-containing protein [Desulfobacterales bacterium]|nr:DUF1778 domain-containing protein [Desulfobacterales bacterium]
MGTARLDMRLDDKIKAKAEKASALLGMKSLTEYVVKLMDEDATRVIRENDRITLEKDQFAEFMEACDKAEKPNRALRKAAELARKMNIS